MGQIAKEQPLKEEGELRADQKNHCTKMSFFCKIFSFVNVNHLEGRFWQLYIIKFIKKNLHLLHSESSTS